MRKLGARHIGFCQLLLLGLALANPLWALAAQTLESIEYTSRDGVAVVEIGFSGPVQYLSHFPLQWGGTVQVFLGPRAQVDPDIDTLPITQVMRAPKSPDIPLTQVSFTIDKNGESSIRLDFTRVVNFEIGAGERINTVQVLLPGIVLHQAVPSLQTEVEADALSKLMQQGRDALKQGDAPRAIAVFTSLVGMPAHRYSADALELLGVARERNGQQAHAKAIYEDYLKRYPDGEGTVRVKQRLADLLSSQLRPSAPLKEAKAEKRKTYRSELYGSLAQYFYHDQTTVGDSDTVVDQRLLLNQLTLDWRIRSDEWDVRNFFYANHYADFISHTGQPLTIESAYSQFSHDSSHVSGRIGRQTGVSGGVLGKYDGVKLGYDATHSFRLIGQAGYPVELSDKRGIQSNKPFVSLGLELDGEGKLPDVLPYFVHQKVDGIVDRTAVGSELRYFHPKGNFYGMLDYDTSYRALNIFLLRGQYNWRETTSFDVNLDFRKNPLLFTSDALVNRIDYTTIDDMLQVYSEDEIRALAEEHVGDSASLSLGASHSINSRYQLRGDITFARQEYKFDDFVSGEVLSERDRQTYLFLQLIANQWLSEHDTTVLGTRLSDTSSYRELSLFASNRLPLDQWWRLDLRAQLDRQHTDNGDRLTKFRPSLKVDYRASNSVQFVAELGIEWWRYGGDSLNPDLQRLFVNAGYRWSF